MLFNNELDGRQSLVAKKNETRLTFRSVLGFVIRNEWDDAPRNVEKAAPLQDQVSSLFL